MDRFLLTFYTSSEDEASWMTIVTWLRFVNMDINTSNHDAQYDNCKVLYRAFRKARMND